VIDLHLHTTASDGKLRPSEVVARAAAAGLRVISVTDHDTVAGLTEARDAARAQDVRLVDGIEITAIEYERDVHVLGYFFDPADASLGAFLEAQRADRVERVREIAARLSGLGYDIDVESLIAAAASCIGRSVGRPLLADALVAAGHVADRTEAFDRLLGNNKPAFVPRAGPSLARVTAIIGAAGGIASLAHPGLLGLDEHIPRFAASGLAAIEARHREHDEAAEARYRGLASALGLAVSGGSDFHGEPATTPGSVVLALEDFQALEARVYA
jgi:predicted metal-dependent phosphoesterase TrpH